jgi:hypothetical protein
VKRRARNLVELGIDAAAIGWTAPQVVALRLLKLSQGGPAATVEAQRMISEKVRAGMRIAEVAGRNGPSLRTLEGVVTALHGPVVANHKRLSAGLTRKR